VLPAIHCEVAPRIVRSKQELYRLRYVNAIKYQEPQYFVDAEGNWFQGILNGYSNRSSWLERTILDRDYVDAELEFVPLQSSPFTPAHWFRYFCEGLWMDKSKAKVQRDHFRKLKTTGELIEWMVENDRFMHPFK
jgi:hypothetical protein